MYVKFTVDNPTTPLRRTDDKNRWLLSMESRGMFRHMKTTSESVFATVEEEYQDNLAVMGFITQAYRSPRSNLGGE